LKQNLIFFSLKEKDWNYEGLNLSSKEPSSYPPSDADDAPLNLSLKSSTSTSKESGSGENILDLVLSKSSGKPNESSVNNLSNLQNLTAGIGLLAGDKGKIIDMI
jgi:hypothetical protein